jgi:hypothetical protein
MMTDRKLNFLEMMVGAGRMFYTMTRTTRRNMKTTMRTRGRMTIMMMRMMKHGAMCEGGVYST